MERRAQIGCLFILCFLGWVAKQDGAWRFSSKTVRGATMINYPVSHLALPVGYSSPPNTHDYDFDLFALYVAACTAVAFGGFVVWAVAFQSTATPQSTARASSRGARVGVLARAKGVVGQVLCLVPLLLGTAGGHDLS